MFTEVLCDFLPTRLRMISPAAMSKANTGVVKILTVRQPGTFGIDTQDLCELGNASKSLKSDLKSSNLT